MVWEGFALKLHIVSKFTWQLVAPTKEFDTIIIAEIVYEISKSIWFPIDFCKIEKFMEILMLDFWSLASDFRKSV